VTEQGRHRAVAFTRRTVHLDKGPRDLMGQFLECIGLSRQLALARIVGPMSGIARRERSCCSSAHSAP
jgi:hypothetical protein